MRSDQCTCQNAPKDVDLSIVGIVSIDEAACIHSEDGNHESLPMHISGMTDIALPDIALKAITSHCTVSNQHIAPDLVTAVHYTVAHQYIAPDLVTAAHCTVSYQHIAPDKTEHNKQSSPCDYIQCRAYGHQSHCLRHSMWPSQCDVETTNTPRCSITYNMYCASRRIYIGCNF